MLASRYPGRGCLAMGRSTDSPSWTESRRRDALEKTTLENPEELGVYLDRPPTTEVAAGLALPTQGSTVAPLRIRIPRSL